MTPAARLLSVQHRAHQIAIRAQAIRDAYTLWRSWTPGDDASWRRMLALAQPVVAARHGVSSAVAARYFEQMAALAGKRTRASIAAPLPEEQVQASLTATGLVGTVVALSRGASLQAAAQTGFVRFSGGLSRLVLLGGRETVVSSAARSRVQWERETGGDACEFCQMLADRGPVYSEESADFPAHDHCECSAVPLF